MERFCGGGVMGFHQAQMNCMAPRAYLGVLFCPSHLREFACETHVILAPGAFALGSKQAEMHHFSWKSMHKYA